MALESKKRPPTVDVLQKWTNYKFVVGPRLMRGRGNALKVAAGSLVFGGLFEAFKKGTPGLENVANYVEPVVGLGGLFAVSFATFCHLGLNGLKKDLKYLENTYDLK